MHNGRIFIFITIAYVATSVSGWVDDAIWTVGPRVLPFTTISQR